MKLERFLHLIGIDRYTNRDELMDELEKLPDEDFIRLLGRCDLSDMVTRASCVECKAANGGKCVHQGDNEYCGEFDPVAWLNRTWVGTRIITEGATADV